MFDDDYRIKGIHATKAKFLSKDKVNDGEKGANVFERLMDVYMIAPIVGMVYGNIAEIDTESSDTANIMASVMIKEQRKLKYIYRLIMLCDEKSNLTNEEKINRAFRDDTDPQALEKNMNIFHSYMRGGIDVLYDKFTEDCTTKDDYLNAIYEFVCENKRELDM